MTNAGSLVDLMAEFAAEQLQEFANEVINCCGDDITLDCVKDVLEEFLR